MRLFAPMGSFSALLCALIVAVPAGRPAAAVTCGARAGGRHGAGFNNTGAGDWGMHVRITVRTSPVCDPNATPNRNNVQASSEVTVNGTRYYVSAGYIRSWGGSTTPFANTRSANSPYEEVTGCPVAVGTTLTVDSVTLLDQYGDRAFGYQVLSLPNSCSARSSYLYLPYNHTDWVYGGVDFTASDIPGSGGSRVLWTELSFYSASNPDVNPVPYPCVMIGFSSEVRFHRTGIGCQSFETWTQ